MSKLITVSPELADLSDRELGRQLVAQFERANEGMIEYIAFGALVLNVQALINSPRGVNSPERGRTAKGMGLKAWLKEYASDITEPTAYRYAELAEIVRDEIGLGAKTDLHHVLKGDKLEPKEQKLRHKISDFVAGKSQRQLLIGAGKFNAKRGGSNGRGDDDETPEEKHKRLVDSARETAIGTFSAFDELGDRWMLTKDAEIALAVENAKKFVKRAEAWLETPAPKRAQFQLEKHLGKEDAS